ncbi:MAG: glucoamylase family protein [Saprospiraceae bacterium]|nr:glucoamylase family protein [Saprospiraceae bacterium]
MSRTCYTLSFLLLATLAANCQTPSTPQGLTATGYERHIALSWQSIPEPGVTGYRIYRSTDGGASYTFLKQVGLIPLAVDWTGDEGEQLTRHYQVAALIGALEGNHSEATSATTTAMDDEALLEMTQRATFRYFWDYAHPVSGMARERSNGDPNLVTTGGSGFGVMAILVGAERGWVSREAALNRLIQIASFLQFADRFHGVFPHWMNGTNGNVIPFSQFDDGGDLVETAFLMQGLLAARQYFDQDTPLENALRDVITGLWEDVEWDWYRRNNSPVLYWHWSPNYNWQMNFALRGFYEAQIVYILAAASPTHPVPASLYQTGWTSGNYANPSVHYGYKIYCGPFGGGPLFFAHYSYLGFDPRGRKDAFCNYFVRNRNHSLIQQAYSAANPENHTGYSAECWGLTSCDGPNGYAAHDVWPTNDDGTIAPTAALSSMPYAPDACMAALRYFYRQQGEKLWGPYGFYDAFNLNQNWFAPSYLAIDQGPIVGMIENYRSGLLWRLFMQNPEIEPALTAIGFVPDNTPTLEAVGGKEDLQLRVFPNPAVGKTTVQMELWRSESVETGIRLLDASGKILHTFLPEKRLVSGVNQESLRLPDLPAGTYWLEITAGEKKYLEKLMIK